MNNTAQPEIRLEDYRPTDFVIATVDLTFRLAPQRTVVTSKLVIERRPGVDPQCPLMLDGDELEFLDLKVDGTAAAADRFDATPERLTIRDLPASGAFSLEVVTAIAPQSNTKLMGLYLSNGVYCTQCEAEGFRRITYFLDRPDVLAVYTTTIDAPKDEAPLLLSNGNPVDTGELEHGRHFAVWHDPHPKPSYLFALVAGDLGAVRDTFTTASDRKVELAVFVEHGKEDRAAYAMDALKRSMHWDEERFGREYDLDIFMIVAVSDFNMGAMENKGLNIFNDKYVLADSNTATDTDYANIEAIIAHEYFHNWTGNRITCRDWFQLCLKEGLTVYRDHEFSADMRSRAVKRIAEVRLLKAHQFPEDNGPLAHPVRPVRYREINNFYTATVYEKGSEVVRMLETILDQSGFRKGMDLYFDRHDGEAATVEDFITCFEDATGEDLSQFFLWYQQAGTPTVAISSSYDPDSQTLKLELEQTQQATPGQPAKKPLQIPLRMSVFESNGLPVEPSSVEGIDVRGDVFHIRERKHTVEIRGVRSRPVLSANRGFSAPVAIHGSQSDRDLAMLSRIEPDAFSRWQALNDLAMRHLVRTGRKKQETPRELVNPDIVASLIAMLVDDCIEPALRAQMVTLPAETDIAREIGSDIDPVAIRQARRAMIAGIATQGATEFRSVYELMKPQGAYSPDSESAGRRALCVSALSYLAVATGDPDVIRQVYASADNMTMLGGSLMLLVHEFPDSEEARSCLADFADRYADNPLVLDKWLTIQATIPGESALPRVREMMKSPLYDASNPNRIRALIGAYATGNPTGFNLEDGEGYAFLAGQVIDLDRRNPQVAARMLTAMRSWRSLEPVRKGAAEHALRKIASQENLSSDVSDIVGRMLE